MSPPTDEPDSQNASFDDAQTKAKTTKQTPGELQSQSRGVPEQRQQHKVSLNGTKRRETNNSYVGPNDPTCRLKWRRKEAPRIED